jgi:hypothetical protein
MKYFWNGVAIAAALAIVAPHLAQAQTSGTRPARPKSAAMAHSSGGHAMTGHASRAGSGMMAQAGDNVANQLNRQELQRLGASPPPAAMPMPPRPMAPPQPGLSTSSSTYIPPSPPGPVSTMDASSMGPKESGGGYIAPSRPGPVSTMDPSSMGPKESGGGYIPAPTGPMPMPPPPPVSAPIR